ncbi:phage head closure protein [Bacillus infantis]|uniref:Head-tail adaptor protein n=1 Tax=Bacillus infantis TaxID=324767 RepID=A0A5D4RGV5_9BACI|nr:phage head closure protein [Bacillus infantis]TYS50090.1 head-tail adaptor protein [Bacillus infantis]
MNPGLFKHRITFQENKSPSKNANGFPVNNWTDFKRAWAMIKTPNDKSSNVEFYSAASTYARDSKTFVVRYTEGIHSDMRIEYRGRYFDIVAPPINDNEAFKTLTIVGREVR